MTSGYFYIQEAIGKNQRIRQTFRSPDLHSDRRFNVRYEHSDVGMSCGVKSLFHVNDLPRSRFDSRVWAVPFYEPGLVKIISRWSSPQLLAKIDSTSISYTSA
jgi:hypothetical protein